MVLHERRLESAKNSEGVQASSSLIRIGGFSGGRVSLLSASRAFMASTESIGRRRVGQKVNF
jgi:hypothetical protein